MLRKSFITTLAAASLLTAGAQAAIVPSAGYSVSTVLTGRSYGAFDAYTDTGDGQNYVYGWTGGELKQYSLASGSQTGSLGAPSPAYSSSTSLSCSFVSYRPDGSAWVGFTDWQNSALDGIYKVSSSGVWESVNSMSNNFSIAFYGTEAFVMAGNTVYLVNGTTGESTAFAQVGSSSNQIAFSGGGLLVGTYGLPGDNYLLEYSNGQVDAFLAAVGAGDDWDVLMLGDASDTLATYSVSENPTYGTYQGGVSGVAVDEEGNIFYAGNDYTSGTTLVDEVGGDNVGTGLYSSIIYLDELDGKLYYALYGQDGISYLEAVPEPSVYAVFGGMMTLLFTLYYRRRKTRLRE